MTDLSQTFVKKKVFCLWLVVDAQKKPSKGSSGGACVGSTQKLPK